MLDFDNNVILLFIHVCILDSRREMGSVVWKVPSAEVFSHILFHEKIMGPDYSPEMKSASFEMLGVVLIVFGSGYVGLGLFDVVPLELTGVSISNIRIPAGIAVVGCLIAAFSTKSR